MKLPEWITGRARFNSQIPLEFAYAAWDALEPAPESGADDYAAYRTSTPELLTAFQARRLEAERVAATVPNVQQVVNELEVTGEKATSTR